VYGSWSDERFYHSHNEINWFRFNILSPFSISVGFRRSFRTGRRFNNISYTDITIVGGYNNYIIICRPLTIIVSDTIESDIPALNDRRIGVCDCDISTQILYIWVNVYLRKKLFKNTQGYSMVQAGRWRSVGFKIRFYVKLSKWVWINLRKAHEDSIVGNRKMKFWLEGEMNTITSKM